MFVRFLYFATGGKKTIAYKELIGKIEQMHEWFSYAMLATALSLGLFPISCTVVNYFILDIGTESYLFVSSNSVCINLFQIETS